MSVKYIEREWMKKIEKESKWMKKIEKLGEWMIKKLKERKWVNERDIERGNRDKESDWTRDRYEDGEKERGRE